MQATRTLQQRALSQLAKNAAARNGLVLGSKAATASRALAAARPVSTQATTNDEALAILNKQRSLRPSSPHFTIYEPQLSWLSSIANRVTGSGLSIGIYALAISYIAAPVFGAGFEGASIIYLIGSLPLWAKLSAKTIVGLPFWYHTFNGLRHLSWDMGWLLDLRKSWIAGYTVIATSVAATAYTTFLL